MINERIKKIRKIHKLSQTKFGDRIKVSRDVINNIENNRINISDLIIKTISMEFNVSEEWLRSGEGLPEKQEDTFSLDEYIKSKDGTELEIEIIKTYFELDPEIRKTIIKHFKEKFTKSEMSITNDKMYSLPKANYSKVAEAEEKYIKSVLINAQEQESTVLNFTENTENKRSTL